MYISISVAYYLSRAIPWYRCLISQKHFSRICFHEIASVYFSFIFTSIKMCYFDFPFLFYFNKIFFSLQASRRNYFYPSPLFFSIIKINLIISIGSDHSGVLFHKFKIRCLHKSDSQCCVEMFQLALR